MKKWKCTVCGYIHEGDAPPEQCPLCKAPGEKFEELVETEQPEEKKGKNPQWKCSVCGYILEGEEPPKECPICKAAGEKFVEIDAEESEVTAQGKSDAKMAEPAAKKPGVLIRLMLRLHMHPLSVHVPNGILPVAVIFLAIAIFLGIKSLEPVVFYNLIAVLITMPLVMLTGITEWKNRYNGAKSFIFFTKIICASIVTLLLIVLVGWRMFEPGVADADSPFRLIYFGVAAVMLAATGIAGHLGGKLVFGARDSRMKK